VPYVLPGISPRIYIPQLEDDRHQQQGAMPSKMALDIIRAMSDKGIKNKS
jgi:hypothetical protein